MDIEIARVDRMSQSGSAILRSMQNETMPILDLFVRESIQNSLDAVNYSNVDDYININIATGTFMSTKLSEKLSGITSKLNSNYPEDFYEYLTIEDSNTVGLTGPLFYDDINENGDYGNLLKLVYDITKAQSQEGAGGSWGLGKSIYYRVGVGLVIYYSRIIKEYGVYEERLAVCLVEDETKKNSLIPVLEYDKNKRGIAWWGKSIGKNRTIPITDPIVINEILDIFGIHRFISTQTGTKVIIPYVNISDLLSDNDRIEERVNSSRYWMDDVTEYLTISAQRWYSCRIDNKNYKNGKYIKMSINDECIRVESMAPVFQVMQSLYNRSFGVINSNDYFVKNNISNTDIHIEKISDRKYLTTSVVGSLSFIKISKEDLKMMAPDNEPSPYLFFNIESNNDLENSPILAYIRKPGLIIDYQINGDWLSNVPPTDSDEYLISVFVLNSKAKFKENFEIDSLEEYIRSGEKSDHMEWFDKRIGSENINLLKLTKDKVRKNLKSTYESKIEDDTDKKRSVYTKALNGLLPTRNFGTKPSSKVKKASGEGSVGGKGGKNRLIYRIIDNVDYFDNGMQIQIRMNLPEGNNKYQVELQVQSESKSISFVEWKRLFKTKFPFKIDEVYVNVQSENYCINSDISLVENEKIRMEFLYDENLSLSIESDNSKSILLDFTILIFNRQYRPEFKISIIGGDK